MKNLNRLHHFLEVIVECRPIASSFTSANMSERSSMSNRKPCFSPIDTQVKVSDDDNASIGDMMTYRSLAKVLQYLIFT